MTLDWADEWRKRHENSAWVCQLKEKGISNEDFWDGYKFGDKNEEYNKYANYPGQILEKMMKFIGSESTVLDIGAGAGAYTIPFAKVAQKVTVVEPSKGQVSRLMRSAERERLKNIEVINKRWEDVNEEELERYDLVNAAYCFHMPDIKVALQKMLNAAKNVLFLIALVEHGFDDVYEIIFGEYDNSPNYIYLYNVLYQMGNPANVEIVAREYLLPLDMQLENLHNNYDLTPDVEEKVRAYLLLTNRLIEKNGELWVKRKYNDAMIWCCKEWKDKN